MKEQFQLLAEYNALVNADMLKVLDGIPGEMVTRDVGSYYKSILGILNHIMMGDANWLSRLANHFPQLGFLKDSFSKVSVSSPSDAAAKDLNSFRTLRTELDAAIKRAIDAMDEAQFSTVLVFKNPKGIEQRKSVWMSLLHMFNHETHHRGQVSVMLDQLKVENDFSGLAWRF